MLVIGKNPILEILRNSPKDLNKIILLKTIKPDAKFLEIKKLGEENKITIQFLNKFQFEKFFNRKNKADGITQGCIAFSEDYQYSSLKDIVTTNNITKNPVIIILDEITDPQNMGAIIRSGVCLGASGVIIPRHNSAEVNHTVIKASSGAVNHIMIAKETNLVNSIKYLKDNGFWIVGMDAGANKELYNADLKIPLGIVIGNEGKGMRKIMKDNCDILLKIPMSGKLDSLNASVSAGIILYEIFKQKS